MQPASSMVDEWAHRLQRARADHAQARSFAYDHPAMTLDDAYAVQHGWARARLADGARLLGYKVGLTTPAVQRACNIAEPAYGHLFDDMVFTDGVVVAERLFEPRVETELAFVLKTTLSGPDCTGSRAMDAVDFITPAIEIVDTRFRLKDPATGVERGTPDAVADNTSSAGIVLGQRRFRPGAFDLRWASAILYRNAVVEASGVSGVVMNDPANSLAWLANALHRRGERLQAGQVVLSGSFITPFPAVAGDSFLADFGPLGTIALRFE